MMEKCEDVKHRGVIIGRDARHNSEKFARLTAISDDVAGAVAAHKGKLDLSGLQVLPDEAARALARHDGEVVLTGRTTLAESATATLRSNPKITLPKKFQSPIR